MIYLNNHDGSILNYFSVLSHSPGGATGVVNLILSSVGANCSFCLFLFKIKRSNTNCFFGDSSSGDVSGNDIYSMYQTSVYSHHLYLLFVRRSLYFMPTGKMRIKQ